MRYHSFNTNTEAALRDLGNKNPRVRVEAAEALGKVDPKDRQRALPALRPLLSDRSPDVRYMAALSLGRLQDREVIGELATMVEEDPEPMPRQAAAAALGEIGDPRAAPALAAALRSGCAEVRFQAATSISRVDAERAVEPLREALGDEDAEVRASAAAGLGDLRHQDSCDLLARSATDDPDERVQAESATALARMGDRRGTATLVRLLDHRELSLLAAEHLYRCPDPAAETALRQAQNRWLASNLLKVWCSAALARLGHEEARPRLLALVRHRQRPVRGLAIQVLGDIDQPWSLKILKTLLEPGEAGEFEGWREEIVEALHQTEVDQRGTSTD